MIMNQPGKSGFYSVNGEVRRSIVDDIFDTGRSQIHNYLDALQNTPDLLDNYMSMSKEDKSVILKEVDAQANLPKSIQEAETIALQVIGHAVTLGIIDATIMLVSGKLPPLFNSHAKKITTTSLSEELTKAQVYDMLDDSNNSFKNDAPTAGKNIIKHITTEMEDNVKLYLQCAKELVVEGNSKYQNEIVNIMVSAYQAGLGETAAVFLEGKPKVS